MVDWIVGESDAGARVDHFVAARGKLSHAAARRVIEEGAVRVNGRRARKGARLANGDRVAVEGTLPDAEALRPQPEDGPLDVLFCDESVIAVNKPAGMPTHPLRAGERGTLAGRLVARFPECSRVGADPREAGFAHRLDADTSGVLVAARNQEVWQALRRAFHEGRAEKTYLALVEGDLAMPGAVEMGLLHDPQDRRRVHVVPPDTPDARYARTAYEPIAHAAGRTLVRAVTSTGRMHQVRAHLAHLGHPICGDALYGDAPALDGAPGHFLHAAVLRLPHPGGSALDVTAPLPPERREALLRLGIPPAALDEKSSAR